jgi:hypothetical protein
MGRSDVQGCEAALRRGILAKKRWGSQKVRVAKEALLALPTGTPRPRHNAHPLGTRLTSYLTQSHSSYDPEFEQQVRLKHPDWFTPRKEKTTAATKKATLLALPLDAPRPGYDTVLGRVLSNYVSPAAKTYDADFRRRIRERFPSWFRTGSEDSKPRKPRRKDLPNKHTERAQERKAVLLALSLGSPRPDPTTPLGRALKAYISPSIRDRYDADFLRAISLRFPYWFR